MRVFAPAVVFSFALVASSLAHAETTTVTATGGVDAHSTSSPPTSTDGPRARWHPQYGAEIEPHFVIAGLDKYQAGLGFGLNVSIPIFQHAPFKKIDDDISFGVGLDFVRYAAYKPQEPNGANVLTYAWYVPVFVQWNLWLGARASMFVEPALVFRFASYPENCYASQRCAETDRVLPTGSLGFRFRIFEHVPLVVRVGWPMVTIGGSWL